MSTCYLSTSNSSLETEARAKLLSDKIGSFHISIPIETIVSATISVFEVATGRRPIYKILGGSHNENLALQNVQARIRMVVSYLFAQLLPWVNGRIGSLLVLGSANVDETLRGYLTKYDCSSADVNPIGGISKNDLRKFVMQMCSSESFDFLHEFMDAAPTAELEPTTTEYTQSDESDMGFTYDELSKMGTLRSLRMGPLSMFKRLLNDWEGLLTPAEIADKVRRFMFFYSINRHKSAVLPPSYHMSPYGTDDNRFDLRPFLYNSNWDVQFSQIGEIVLRLGDKKQINTA